MQLHFESRGDGEPIIILHGLFGSHDNWLPVAKALSSHFRVICVDLRNHGKSPHGAGMTHAAMADDVRQLMGELGIPEACVLGHSMGGKVAMRLALDNPGLVSKLVVVDIGPWAYPQWHREILDALMKLHLARMTDRKQAEEALAPAIPELGVRRFLLKNMVRDHDGKFKWRIDLAAINDGYNQLNGEVTTATALSGPTLFVRGGDSEYLHESDFDRLRSIFPNARLETIPGAGHWVQHDAPEAFLRVLRGFLVGESGVPAGSP